MSFLSPLRSLQFANGSEWYEVSDTYDNTVSGFTGNYYYYGFLANTGKWIIQQYNLTTGATRYTNGINAYAAAWTAALAGQLTFGYYNALSNTSP